MAVTVFPLCVHVADQPWVTVWLPAKLNCRFQLVRAEVPVLAMVIVVVKPAPQSFCTAYVTMHAPAVPVGDGDGDGDREGETDGDGDGDGDREGDTDGDGDGDWDGETDGDGEVGGVTEGDGDGFELPGVLPQICVLPAQSVMLEALTGAAPGADGRPWNDQSLV